MSGKTHSSRKQLTSKEVTNQMELNLSRERSATPIKLRKRPRSRSKSVETVVAQKS